MRTALALLFLLALAAIPGALLPQRDLNAEKTAKYIADHGELGVWMDRLQLFGVFNSAWFTAIYLLLFVSLVGCLTPRMWEHYRALRTPPVPAPRNLRRMPRHISETVDGDPAALAQRISGNLRGWRRTIREVEPSKAYPDGAVEVSAEKGYLRELGNLVFHFALLGLLLTIGLGKLYGYEGTRILMAGDDAGPLCNTATAAYDPFRAGPMVDGTDLSRFCIKIDDFTATFLPNGQPDMYDAKVSYTTDPSSPVDSWSKTSVRVNKPLRIAGDRVYVLGNGFAPKFTVGFVKDGKRVTRTQTVPFLPQETQTMLSEGAARFDTPGGMYPNEDDRRKHQIALQGIFAPDSKIVHGNADNGVLTSNGAEPKNPMVAVQIYEGDTGLDTGKPQNVYQLDQKLINQGRLNKMDGGSVNIKLGETKTLPGGTTIRFDGYQRWVSIQVSHDPTQGWVLVSAVTMVIGLVISLVVKRRRIWARLVPVTDDGQRRTVVEVAGLARTDQAGWGDGFDGQAKALLDEEPSRRRRGRL